MLNILFTKQLGVLSPLWGFRFVDVPVPGVDTPVCVLSHLRCFSPDTNNFLSVLPWEYWRLGRVHAEVSYKNPAYRGLLLIIAVR